jgi:hypothetical protein
MIVNDHVRKLYMEGLCRSMEYPGTCFYAYVTYDKNKLKGFKIGELQRYNMQAWATVPISENQVLDMRLFTDQDNRILDFTMQYRGPFNNLEYALASHTQLRQQTTIHIRSDYGHVGGVHYPHFDIQLFDNYGRKVSDQDVPQDENFSNYESAINAVFMQVEKLSDPLIGAKYWLSPAEIAPERVSILSDLRKKYNILTSLSVVSRIINLRTLEETRRGTIDELNFWKIAEYVLQSCKEQETQLGGPLDVEVKYNTDMSMLPFFFFQPEGAQHIVKAYDLNGKDIEFEPVYMVHEQKGAAKRYY